MTTLAPHDRQRQADARSFCALGSRVWHRFGSASSSPPPRPPRPAVSPPIALAGEGNAIDKEPLSTTHTTVIITHRYIIDPLLYFTLLYIKVDPKHPCVRSWESWVSLLLLLCRGRAGARSATLCARTLYTQSSPPPAAAAAAAAIRMQTPPRAPAPPSCRLASCRGCRGSFPPRASRRRSPARCARRRAPSASLSGARCGCGRA